jgi:hypothetical protein
MRSLVSVSRLLGAVLAAALIVAPAAQSVPAGSSTSDVWWFATGKAVDGASSKLVRTGSGVSLSLRTRELAAGDAVTVWWVVFNHPDQCEGEAGSPLRCAEADLFNPDVSASVQYAGGHVVGGSGRYAVGSHLSEGSTAGCALGDLLCTGLIDARRADVHLVVRTHGPALTEFLPRQFNSFGAACGNVEPRFGGGGPNTCEDLQFAAHETL